MGGISLELFEIKEIKTRRKKSHSGKEELSALHKDVILADRRETGMLRKESQKTWLDHPHRVKKKGYLRAVEELKQRIKAKAPALNRYKNRVKQHGQNRLF